MYVLYITVCIVSPYSVLYIRRHTVTNSTIFTLKHSKILIYVNWNEEKWSNQVGSQFSFFSALNYSHILGIWREFKIRNKFFPTTKCFTTLENTLNAAAAAICMVHATVYHVQSDLFNCFAKYFKWFSILC